MCDNFEYAGDGVFFCDVCFAEEAADAAKLGCCALSLCLKCFGEYLQVGSCPKCCSKLLGDNQVESGFEYVFYSKSQEKIDESSKLIGHINISGDDDDDIVPDDVGEDKEESRMKSALKMIPTVVRCPKPFCLNFAWRSEDRERECMACGFRYINTVCDVSDRCTTQSRTAGSAPSASRGSTTTASTVSSLTRSGGWRRR